jgi:hypothetical protein
MPTATTVAAIAKAMDHPKLVMRLPQR